MPGTTALKRIAGKLGRIVPSRMFWLTVKLRPFTKLPLISLAIAVSHFTALASNSLPTPV